ncbi:hypothetical protein TNCV_1407931 [Trichonephila clavipes]|nr:hypothetical protein TNCV_1407931 [Trichonephila clavipes]
MKIVSDVFHFWYDDTTDCFLGNLALGWGFELLRTFGLVRWGLGGVGHVEGTGEKLSFASQAARYYRSPGQPNQHVLAALSAGV